MANRIHNPLGVTYPAVQAPMTYIARADLAAAVSKAGGLGMIETLTGRRDHPPNVGRAQRALDSAAARLG